VDRCERRERFGLKIVLKSVVFIANIRARLETLEFKVQLVRRVELFSNEAKA